MPITELLQNVTVLKDNTLMPIMFVEIVTINVKLVNHTKIVKSVQIIPTEKTLTLLLMSIPVLVLTDTMITEPLSVNNVMLNVQLVTPMSTVSPALSTDTPHLVVIVIMICGAITGSVKIVLINVMDVKDLEITVSIVNQTELMPLLVTVQVEDSMMDLMLPVLNATVNAVPVPDKPILV